MVTGDARFTSIPVWRNTSESAPEGAVIRDPGQGYSNSLTAERRLQVPVWTKP